MKGQAMDITDFKTVNTIEHDSVGFCIILSKRPPISATVTMGLLTYQTMDSTEQCWVIDRLFVPEEYRRRGIGRLLLDKLKSNRRSLPISVIPGGYNMVYKDLLKFYRACGFRDSPYPGKLVYDGDRKGEVLR